MSKICTNLGQYQQSLERGLVNVVSLLPLPSKKQSDPNGFSQTSLISDISGKLIGQTSVVTVSDIKDTFYGASGMEVHFGTFFYNYVVFTTHISIHTTNSRTSCIYNQCSY